MICKDNYELIVGFPKKDKIQISNTNSITHNDFHNFDEVLMTNYLREMKDLIPSEFILDDIHHFEYNFYHNIELYGSSSLPNIYLGIDHISASNNDPSNVEIISHYDSGNNLQEFEKNIESIFSRCFG